MWQNINHITVHNNTSKVLYIFKLKEQLLKIEKLHNKQTSNLCNLHPHYCEDLDSKCPRDACPRGSTPAGQHTKRQRSLPNGNVVMYHWEKELKECSLMWDSATWYTNFTRSSCRSRGMELCLGTFKYEEDWMSEWQVEHYKYFGVFIIVITSGLWLHIDWFNFLLVRSSWFWSVILLFTLVLSLLRIWTTEVKR